MEKHLLSENIRSLADSLGIDAVGFTEASEFTSYALNYHQRRDPKLTLPNAKSIIIAGIYIGGVTMPEWKNAWYGRTSRLYLSGFFLDVVKPLVPVAEFLRQEGYQTKICDGSLEEGSILPLKLAAIRAGLGWQGKHSLLISKKFGTFLALGGIITDADLEHNTIEESDRCRNCDKCQTACPLAALDQPYVLNVKKCMSYLLQNDKIPENLKIVMENRIGDCEICQDSCPWNRKHLKSPLATKMTDHFQKKIKDWGDSFYLPNLSRLSENGYKDMFGHLNTDIPYHLFRRNVLIAMERAERLTERANQ
ncbi:MAG: epoxyqueuosine reductase [Deltaproteobacteria bacterium]|jgi:epoxyqueuosine reductase|nr:epoxyqueuosine reductase [Deltaproteobacteria bacterium]MBW2583801.1 epoxyqueuosine reductase [Deltaproteobacteria bacterium]